MLRLLLLCGFSLFAGAAHADDDAPRNNRLTPEEVADGWIQLFDGETTFGWKANNEIPWKVADGTIRAGEGPPGLLVTTTEFADYELKCDFRLEPGGNSGIFLRTGFQPADPSRDCYELNVCDSHPTFKTGSLVGVAQPVKAVTGEGAWKTFHVRLLGNRITVKLDGDEILDFKDERPAARRTGFIGLQKNAGTVEFRNVCLRPLSTAPLFNGKDLTGWRIVPGGASRFEVVDETIHVVNGRGYLETERAFGDFLLQADCRTNGRHLNSGIFFRAIPGTESNPADGYECQIRHEWMGDDRTKPVDFGTGAIYRRAAARKVVSNDGEWCTLTVAARGSHFSVWVNGFPVTDWTDTRAPHDNPRQGLRLAPGQISLQGHDPTTDLNFRNLRIAGYPDAP